MDFAKIIRTIPDYPKPGIMFRDITTLLGNGPAFSAAVDALVEAHKDDTFNHVAGIEARGFILGGAVAHRLGIGFIPVRKKGELPWATIDDLHRMTLEKLLEGHGAKELSRKEIANFRTLASAGDVAGCGGRDLKAQAEV